jgi:hypothetical protein
MDFPVKKDSDDYVKSPPFYCFGHEWVLAILPGGETSTKDGIVSVCLLNTSDEGVTLDWSLTLMKNDGSESATFRVKGDEDIFDGFRDDGESDCWREYNFKRSILQRTPRGKTSMYLDNGSLVIKVKMRLSAGSYVNGITPQQTIGDNMEIFLDDETSDVAFNVKGEVLVAHKGIIKAQAKSLYEMCEASSEAEPMPINDVEPCVFRIMLASLYGGYVLPEQWKKHSDAILKAAAKWGFDKLKSEAEIWYSKSLKLTVGNVIDEFLKADGNGHDMVREAAKKFMIEHGKEMIESESFDKLYESKSLVKEIMKAAFDSSESKKRRREDE